MVGTMESGNMQFAILALTLDPNERHIDRHGWHAFAGEISKATEDPAVKQIAPTVWQVEFGKNPAALGRLIVSCENFEYSYGVLPFADEPLWIHQTRDSLSGRRG